MSKILLLYDSDKSIRGAWLDKQELDKFLVEYSTESLKKMRQHLSAEDSKILWRWVTYEEDDPFNLKMYRASQREFVYDERFEATLDAYVGSTGIWFQPLITFYVNYIPLKGAI